ncbi:MAG TPA: signal peptidase II [Syntrophomonadaceae bacterium]|nr:signal peptidase II [Syntrophomonadaceae bacterium]
MRFWLTIIAVIFIDQLCKFTVESKMVWGQSWEVVPGVLDFALVHNYGAAFGIMQGKSWFFLIMAFIVIAIILYLYSRYSFPPLGQYAAALLIGGAIGNFIDRWFYGYVIDFISIGWWPVFNIADMAIVMGGILFFIFIWQNEKQEGTNERD